MLRLYFLQSLPVFLDTSQLVLQRLHLGAVQRTHGIKTQGKGTLAAKSSTVQRKISAAVPDPQYTHSLCAHWNRPLAQHVYLSVAFSLKLFSRADSFFSSSLHSASQLSKCCCAEAGARSSGRRAFTAGAHACTDTILGTQKGMPDTCTFPAKFCSPARGPCSLMYSC